MGFWLKNFKEKRKSGIPAITGLLYTQDTEGTINEQYIFEPLNKNEKQAFQPVNSIWRDVVNDIRTVIQQSKDYLHIPVLATEVIV